MRPTGMQWRQTMEVARWEFSRFVKWRQQFIGLGFMLVLGLGGTWVGRTIAKATNRPVTVAVVNQERLDFALPATGSVTWDAGVAPSEEEARAALAAERVDGVLLVRSATDAELVLRRRAGWTEPVEAALTEARKAAAFERLALAPDQRAALDAPFLLTASFLDADDPRRGRATRVAALLLLFLGLIVLFSGFGSLFAGITGEKQQRVTEQMVSMVTPQTWMDGKILGLAGVALVGAGFLVLSGVIALRFFPVALGREPISLPPIIFEPGLLLLILLVTVLGVAMWFCFLAAIAATIDDPNSSTRTMLLFVPMLPAMAAFALVRLADTGVAQALAIFPLTSMAVLPVRLTMTTVPWWEPVLAVVLLAATALLFRRAAGKIFALAILMYGKEPTLRELWRWMREA